MSVSRVVLPVLDLEQNDDTLHKVVLKGAKHFTEQRIASDNQSANSITFTVTPPSQNTVIDRRIDIEYQFDMTCLQPGGAAAVMTFADDATQDLSDKANIGLPEGIQKIGGLILDADITRLGNTVGFRQMPLSSITQNLVCQINGTHISVAPREHIHAMMQYTSAEWRETALSGTPHHPDTWAGTYDRISKEAAGTDDDAIRKVLNAENPISCSSARKGEKGRGINSRAIDDGGASLLDGALTTVRVTVREPLCISPFALQYGSGMTNINQLKVDIQFDASKLNNIFSVCNAAGTISGTGGNQIGSVVNTFVGDSAKLVMKYYTPQDDIRIPNEIVLPYNQPLRHTQAVQSLGVATAQSSTGSNRRLNQIPDALYLWVAPQRTGTDRNQAECDWFCSLTTVNIQFQNQVGILSNLNEQQLVQLAKDNGCDVRDVAEARERGYCLKLMFGKDIPLPNNEAPGTRGDYDIQIQCSYHHFAFTGTAITGVEVNELYVNAGHVIISPNECRVQTGLLDLKDNVEAEDMGDHYHGQDPYVGGGLFSSMKKHFGKIGHYVKKGKAAYAQGKALYDQGKQFVDDNRENIDKARGMVQSLRGGSSTGGSITGGSYTGGSMVGGSRTGGNYKSRRH